MIKLNKQILLDTITIRNNDSHKGDYGKALLIGGNINYGGAIIMSALACINSGAGLVSVATHTNNHQSLHSLLPEAMVIDYTDEKYLLNQIHNSDVILIGSGLGLDELAEKILLLVLENTTNQKIIIDGSAITLFAKLNLKVKKHQNIVFTPHQMEWQRLSKIEIKNQTIDNNKKFQQQLNATVVYKKHHTQIYDNEVYECPIGNPGMATGGMGDTLAGMIAGFLAQFDNQVNAVCAATYLHSYIGDILYKDNYVVLPTMISKEISHYMKKFSNMKK